MNQIYRRAARSSLFSLGAQAGQLFLGLAAFAMLSRWLTPADYGTAGLAATVAGLLAVVGDTGVVAALVRSEEAGPVAQASAFWVAAVGAGAMAVVAAVSAPILGWYYRDPRVTALALGHAAAFLVAVPGRVPTALLTRELRFSALAAVTLTGTLVGVALACTIAYLGGGPWALVGQTLATFATQSLLLPVVRPFSAAPLTASREQASRLASFSWRMSGFSASVTAARTGDALVGGRVLGPEGPGVLGLGLKLVVAPIGRGVAVLSNVFLPTILRLDPSEQPRAFIAAVRMTSLAVMPLCLGVVATAPEIVAWLPPHWRGVGGALRAVALGTVAEPVAWYSVAVLTAHGRAGALLRYGLLLVPLGWLSSVTGALAGSPTTLAVAWAAYNWAASLILLGMVWRRLSLNASLARQIIAPLAGSCGSALVARIALDATGLGSTRGGLWFGALVCVLVYGAVVAVAMRRDVRRLVDLVLPSASRKG